MIIMRNTVTAVDTNGDEFRYGCCIDAGSSGSRIYLYRWPVAAVPQRQHRHDSEALTTSSAFIKVERKAIFSQERTPGISHEGGLGIQAVQELVALAKAALLPLDVNPKYVPIYLGATAGMRILIDSSSIFTNEEATTTMAALRRVLHQSGFLFRDAWARTISGEEEGVYAWLVANYLKHNGNLPTPTSAYGALDLGGASTQISFLMTMNRTTSATTSSTILSSADYHPQLQQNQQQFPLRIDHLEYPLFTQSLLYYGVDQARSLYDARYASDKLHNPCYPAGYKDELSLISGSSNWEKCLKNVARLFDNNILLNNNNNNTNNNDSHCCDSYGDHGDDSSSSSHNIRMSQVLPPIENHQKFIAMSTFVYTWDYLGLRIGSETDDLKTLNAQARRVCNMTHIQQVTRYEQQLEYKAIKRRTTKPHTQCFNAAFSFHLLSKGYGLPVDKTPIEIHYEIGGTKVQWALGLMLVEVNKLGSMFHRGNAAKILHSSSSSSTYPQREHDLWSCEICTYHILVAFVFVAMVVVAWNLGYVPQRIKHSTSDTFLPFVDHIGTTEDESTSPRKGR